VESEFKDLEQLYLEDEIRKLSAHDLHSNISKTVEVTRAIKIYEKTCFEFPEQISDEDNDIADIFQKL
jgi:exonuclease I